MQFRLSSLVEIKALFGTMYLRVALHTNGVGCDTVFYHKSSMSCVRFQLLCKILQLDDCKTCRNRWDKNKFGCFYNFFESINEEIYQLQVLPVFMAIIKTLSPYLGRTGFRQYSLRKLAKYGVPYCSLCDLPCNILTSLFCLQVSLEKLDANFM